MRRIKRVVSSGSVTERRVSVPSNKFARQAFSSVSTVNAAPAGSTMTRSRAACSPVIRAVLPGLQRLTR